MEADKPFSCPLADCEMSFVNEDHLTVHKKKHELSLSFSASAGFKNPFIDQTPTPTRFLNALDSELFQEFTSDNPFDATFRKANTLNNGTANFTIPESSSLIASLPDTEVLNTPSITLPTEPETLTLRKDFTKSVKAVDLDNRTVEETTTDTLPFSPNGQSTQELNAFTTDTFENTAADASNLKTPARTNVVQTPVITSVGSLNSVFKTSTTGVPTSVVTKPSTSCVASLPQATHLPDASTQIKAPEQPTTVVQPAPIAPVVQIVIRLPDGQSVPLQVPAVTNPPPAVVQSQEATSSSHGAPSKSLAKMKLKEVLSTNHKLEKRSNGKVRAKALAKVLPFKEAFSGLDLDISPPSSPVSKPGQNGRKRREMEDDPEERRKRSLERNRAAATRCRQKRKQWINALERKADELAAINVRLQNEVEYLRKEVSQLKSMLLAHKDCPVTLQQIVEGPESHEPLTTIRVITSETGDIQCIQQIAEPSSAPVNVEMVEMDMNSSQSMSEASTSDAGEMTFQQR